LKLFVIFQKKKNLNITVYSFFQTFCPLIHSISDMPVRMQLFLEFQQIQRTTSYHFIKVFMLAWKSILLKF